MLILSWYWHEKSVVLLSVGMPFVAALYVVICECRVYALLASQRLMGPRPLNNRILEIL